MDDRALAAIADDVAEHGWSVRPGFLSPGETRELRSETLALWERGEFRHARTGAGEGKAERTEIRRDWIHWLDPEALTERQARYWRAVDRLRAVLNEQLYVGAQRFEGHLAVYPPGAFYKRHSDQFAGTAHRKISVILYLNDAWTAEDGGRLRMYLPGPAGETALDVLPQGGTLVVFRSDQFEHEVLTAHRQRVSVTGWLRAGDTLY